MGVEEAAAAADAEEVGVPAVAVDVVVAVDVAVAVDVEGEEDAVVVNDMASTFALMKLSSTIPSLYPLFTIC